MRTVVVHDRMQGGYQYTCTAPTGKQFASDFKPELTPKEMLWLGVFGGLYMTDCKEEFPASWFTHAKLSQDGMRHAELNYFQIDASQPLSVWKAKGWIHMGRRHTDDLRQIKRWNAMRRHVAQVVYGCVRGDMYCRRKQRQALLHWAYDSRSV
jgi:hypothetical protein